MTKWHEHDNSKSSRSQTVSNDTQYNTDWVLYHRRRDRAWDSVPQHQWNALIVSANTTLSFCSNLCMFTYCCSRATLAHIDSPNEIPMTRHIKIGEHVRSLSAFKNQTTFLFLSFSFSLSHVIACISCASGAPWRIASHGFKAEKKNEWNPRTPCGSIRFFCFICFSSIFLLSHSAACAQNSYFTSKFSTAVSRPMVRIECNTFKAHTAL